MTGRASSVMGWRKTRGRSLHKFGMVQNATTPDGTNVAPIVVAYDTPRERLDALARVLTERTLDTLMLKRAQMLQ